MRTLKNSKIFTKIFRQFYLFIFIYEVVTCECVMRYLNFSGISVDEEFSLKRNLSRTNLFLKYSRPRVTKPCVRNFL